MTVHWTNPYADRDGRWLRGNLHAHTAPASGCGTLPADEVTARYAAAGLDFLALSDHMRVTTPAAAPLTLLPGVEWNAPEGFHTGVYALDPAALQPACAMTDQAELLAHYATPDTLTVLNHPNWTLRPHYHREELQAAQGYDGMEVYNALIRRLDGHELAVEKWDWLLAQGRRVLAFASDDSHIADDIGQAWLCVRARENTPAAIFHALKTGNFYASGGVELTDIRRDGTRLTVESTDGQEVQVHGHGGVILARVHDHSLAFDMADTPIARVTVYGRGSAMAWTQPFFR
jgi:predicted metal-dependent phosphoesterase TrpH